MTKQNTLRASSPRRSRGHGGACGPSLVVGRGGARACVGAAVGSRPPAPRPAGPLRRPFRAGGRARSGPGRAGLPGGPRRPACTAPGAPRRAWTPSRAGGAGRREAKAGGGRESGSRGPRRGRRRIRERRRRPMTARASSFPSFRSPAGAPPRPPPPSAPPGAPFRPLPALADPFLPAPDRPARGFPRLTSPSAPPRPATPRPARSLGRGWAPSPGGGKVVGSDQTLRPRLRRPPTPSPSNPRVPRAAAEPPAQGMLFLPPLPASLAPGREERSSEETKVSAPTRRDRRRKQGPHPRCVPRRGRTAPADSPETPFRDSPSGPKALLDQT